MSAKARIVIDLGFGDGGKGLVVDHLSEWNLSAHESLIVRFSGGQQCGHTVITDDGKKHVFSSYGSGSLAGCPTFSTEDTTMYLPCVINEYNVLVQLVEQPLLNYHPLAMVTTPYDVAYNRAKETIMMADGSCGLGVGATMKRSLETPHKLYAQDFLFMPIFMERMKKIGCYYANLARTNAPLWSEYQLQLEPLLDNFHNALDKMTHNNPYFKVGYVTPKPGQEVIFEGSQGVMLDMDHGVFPNVTYANTTSKNAFKYVDKWGLTPEMNYVTRCYTTRHGLGWMPNEKPIDLINTHEEINVNNDWQGPFRIGDFCYEMVNHAIRIDSNYHGAWKPTKNLVITCVDQRPDFTIDLNRIEGINHYFVNNSATRGNIRPVVSYLQREMK